MSDFTYLGYVLDESCTDDIGCHRKVVCERNVEGGIISLVSARSLQLECVRIPHKGLVMSVLLYSSDNDKER